MKSLVLVYPPTTKTILLLFSIASPWTKGGSKSKNWSDGLLRDNYEDSLLKILKITVADKNEILLFLFVSFFLLYI